MQLQVALADLVVYGFSTATDAADTDKIDEGFSCELQCVVWTVHHRLPVTKNATMGASRTAKYLKTEKKKKIESLPRIHRRRCSLASSVSSLPHMKLHDPKKSALSTDSLLALAAETVVAGGHRHPPRAAWGVRFVEEGGVPIVVDAGGAVQYEEQVIAEMAAATAQASHGRMHN